MIVASWKIIDRFKYSLSLRNISIVNFIGFSLSLSLRQISSSASYGKWCGLRTITTGSLYQVVVLSLEHNRFYYHQGSGSRIAHPSVLKYIDNPLCNYTPRPRRHLYLMLGLHWCLSNDQYGPKIIYINPFVDVRFCRTFCILVYNALKWILM